jgi:uncharacterized membrane protein YdbT with pleckstrin-like domain
VRGEAAVRVSRTIRIQGGDDSAPAELMCSITFSRQKETEKDKLKDKYKDNDKDKDKEENKEKEKGKQTQQQKQSHAHDAHEAHAREEEEEGVCRMYERRAGRGVLPQLLKLLVSEALSY